MQPGSPRRCDPAAAAISNKGWKCIAWTPDDDWNKQELEALAPRFRDMPADQLQAYYRSLARSDLFEGVKPLVRDILAARLSDAEQPPKPDSFEVGELQYLLKRLR